MNTTLKCPGCGQKITLDAEQERRLQTALEISSTCPSCRGAFIYNLIHGVRAPTGMDKSAPAPRSSPPGARDRQAPPPFQPLPGTPPEYRPGPDVEQHGAPPFARMIGDRPPAPSEGEYREPHRVPKRSGSFQDWWRGLSEPKQWAITIGMIAAIAVVIILLPFGGASEEVAPEAPQAKAKPVATNDEPAGAKAKVAEVASAVPTSPVTSDAAKHASATAVGSSPLTETPARATVQATADPLDALFLICTVTKTPQESLYEPWGTAWAVDERHLVVRGVTAFWAGAHQVRSGEVQWKAVARHGERAITDVTFHAAFPREAMERLRGGKPLDDKAKSALVYYDAALLTISEPVTAKLPLASPAEFQSSITGKEPPSVLNFEAVGQVEPAGFRPTPHRREVFVDPLNPPDPRVAAVSYPLLKPMDGLPVLNSENRVMGMLIRQTTPGANQVERGPHKLLSVERVHELPKR